MKYKWKTNKVTQEYSNPYYKFSRHDVLLPSGVSTAYYVCQRTKSQDLFSIVIPITDKEETYLVGQYRYPVNFYSWEFPMGNALATSFLRAAQTELKEETGIVAKYWEKIGEYFVAPGYNTQKASVYIAKNLKHGKTKRSKSELLEVKRIQITQVFSMINKGIIKDGPTIAAAHYLYNYLKIEN